MLAILWLASLFLGEVSFVMTERSGKTMLNRVLSTRYR